MVVAMMRRYLFCLDDFKIIEKLLSKQSFCTHIFSTQVETSKLELSMADVEAYIYNPQNVSME